MLAIRLLRVGKKNQPVFRVVVIDKKNPPKGGNFLEILGFYNPITKDKNLKAERIKYWMSVGAQPSDTVHNLLVKEKIIEGKKIPVHTTKKEEPSSDEASVGKVAKQEEKKEEPIMEKDEAESPKKDPEVEPKKESSFAKASEDKEEKPKEPEKPKDKVKKEIAKKETEEKSEPASAKASASDKSPADKPAGEEKSKE